MKTLHTIARRLDPEWMPILGMATGLLLLGLVYVVEIGRLIGY